MDLTIPEYLATIDPFLRALPVGLVLMLIWIGSFRIPGGADGRFALAGILTGGLLGWLALAEYIGARNIYWTPNTPNVPLIAFGILVPIALGLRLLLRSAGVARLVDALPLSWLVGVQFYRALGVVFLMLWADGYLPWQFAWPAGIGDVMTGVLALYVAWMLAKGAPGGRAGARAWCLFGIADLVVAVTMGALTSPGLLNVISTDEPNMLVTAYPLVMIPTFAVPLSIMLHGLCLWKLRRMGPAGQGAAGQGARISA